MGVPKAYISIPNFLQHQKNLNVTILSVTAQNLTQIKIVWIQNSFSKIIWVKKLFLKPIAKFIFWAQLLLSSNLHLLPNFIQLISPF